MSGSPTQSRPCVADSPSPIAGPLFRAALDVPLARDDHERDNRKLLCLIAAYADAGQPSPTVRNLARRVGFTGKHRAMKIDKRLRELERDGVLVVTWADKEARQRGERNEYELRIGRGADA